MPLPIAAVPPAAATCYTGAAVAAKHFALHAAPYLDTLSSASMAALLLRYYWKKNVPEWAQEDISFQKLLRRKKNTKDHDRSSQKEEELLSASEREEREMANLSSVMEKIQALVESAQFDDDHPSSFQLHAALLAYIQLSAQIKRQEQQAEVCQQQSSSSLDHMEEKDSESTFKEEEMKHENNNHNNNNSAQEEKSQEDEKPWWSSRDSLYKDAKPSEATFAHVPLEYFQFADNPSESPVLDTLKEALTFATWAYYDNAETLSERLADANFSLLKHSSGVENSNRPGHVAYYMAVSSIAKKQIVIGVRGTSTLEDIVTDCCGRPVAFDDRPYYYDHDRGTKRNYANNNHDRAKIEVKAATPPQVVISKNEEDDDDDNDNDVVEVISGHERIWVEDESFHYSNTATTAAPDESQDHLLRCHEGILVSAKRLVDTVQDLVEHWVLARGYQLVICGHSLGAGAATLAAVILRSRLPELTKGPDQKIKVFAFAPPPVLDHHAAMAASSYCTSVINNADIIPRCSLSNLLIFLEILNTILVKLQKQGLAPSGAKGMAAFVKKIAQGPDSDDLLMTAGELRQAMQMAMVKVQRNAAANNMPTTTSMPNTILKNKNGSKQAASCCACGNNNTAASASMDDDMEIVQDQQEGSENGEQLRSNPVPLYIPGVVLLANEPWVKNDDSEDIQHRAEHNRKPQSQQKTKTMAWSVTDGTADVLHFLDFDYFTLRMLTDHTTTSYYTLLDMEYEF